MKTKDYPLLAPIPTPKDTKSGPMPVTPCREWENLLAPKVELPERVDFKSILSHKEFKKL